MKRLLIGLTASMLIAASAPAQEKPDLTPRPNYALAERFSPNKLYRMVPQTRVVPNWFRSSSRFWYAWRTADGISYRVVDPARGTNTLCGTTPVWRPR